MLCSRLPHPARFTHLPKSKKWHPDLCVGCTATGRTTWARHTVLNLQVPETLPEGVLQKMHAPPKPDVPIVDVHDLPNADGYVFAFPTR